MKKVTRSKKEKLNVMFAFMGNKRIKTKISMLMKQFKITQSAAIRMCIENYA